MKRSLLILLFLLPILCNSDSYYVDFASGSDAANGTSTGTAWKHSKGDVNATGIASSTVLQVGDSVTLKGGVVYRGNITVVSGVTYNGTSGWGSGRAILDGSTVIGTVWTQCTNAPDAGGNPNFANIWWTTIPSSVSNCLPTMIANGTNLCQWSQEPDPSDKVFWEVLSEWRTVTTNNISTTRITDATNLIQTNGYYNQCYAAVWVQGNSTVVVPITNYFQSSNTIWFANSTATYNDRDSYYSVINHPQFIDTAGEWAVRTNQNRIYLWPIASANPNTQEISIARHGSAFTGFVNGITVNGFTARGYYQPPDQVGYSGQFCAVGNSDWITHNVTVRSNELYLFKSFNGGPVIDIERGSNAVVSWNYIHDNLISRSMLLNGTRWSRASNNTLSRNNGTGIYFNTSTNGLVENNRILDNIGIHGNGISVYYSTNVLVSANIISNCTSMLTYEGDADITFINNIIDANGHDYRVNEWGGSYGPIRWFNNTLVGNTSGNIFNFVSTGPSYSMQNNIISGGGIVTNKSHNIYTSLAFYQDAFYGWSLGTGESVQTNTSSIFVNPTTHNWRLIDDSPAIGSGTNLSAFITTDFAGTSRGATFDVGAYEFAPFPDQLTGLHLTYGRLSNTPIPPTTNSVETWVKTYGGAQADQGLGVATDASSNVFMAGYFSGTANFGQGNVSSAGGEDIVITKCNFEGTNQWVKTFGSTGSDRCNGIAVDGSGNVFVTGYFNGTINMGGTNLASTGGRDVFLAKYNNAGVHQWSKKYGSPGDEISYAIATDPSGNIFVTGFFQGTGNFGGTNMASANGGLDTFVAKYNTSGAHQWSKRFSPNNSDDIGYGITSDSSGNVISCGVFQGTMNLGGTNHPPTGGYNMYIVKLNGTTGGWIWDFAYGGTTDDFAYSVATDSANNVLLGGFFQGTVNFGGGAYTATQTDGVIVKYNSSGVYQWSKQLGGILGDTVNGVAFDSSNNALATGSFQSTVDFGGGGLISAGSTDGFLAKYASAGTFILAEKFGGTGGENGNSVVADTAGYVLTTGSFSGSFTFATVPVTSAGLSDIFLWRHSP